MVLRRARRSGDSHPPRRRRPSPRVSRFRRLAPNSFPFPRCTRTKSKTSATKNCSRCSGATRSFSRRPGHVSREGRLAFRHSCGSSGFVVGSVPATLGACGSSSRTPASSCPTASSRSRSSSKASGSPRSIPAAQLRVDEIDRRRGPAPVAGRDRRSGPLPRAGPDAQGRSATAQPGLRQGRRHHVSRNAQHRAAGHTQARLDEKLALAAEKSLVNYGFYIGATPTTSTI